MMAKHTELPWHRHDMEVDTICGPDHGVVARCDAKHRTGEENRANKNLIVKAVNAHYPMLEALKGIHNECEDWETKRISRALIRSLFYVARAAIATAEEGV